MRTIKQFCEQARHIDAGLIRAVIRQFGGFDNFKERASDVARYGADGGFSGFIYYTETVAFTKRNKAAILSMAERMADDLGTDTYSLIGGFNCLKISATEAAEAIHNPRSDERISVFNALAWYALEEVCRAYDDAENN